MSFMDKVKSGFTEAGSKAKIVVEINKLKLQNNNKQKEIEQNYQSIGRMYYLQAVGRLADDSGADPAGMVENIARLEAEIEENSKEIKTLANEKDCVCGKPAPLDARFCPSCGHTFES
ncbi:zinc ribbon domain-containing protein [Paenibacillus sp. PAMC21692]|uniref:zinc ribbon domain-containing protein n=1 Tax=Paenibacillus sp. PAMC21692 TaxID=2762320 RepID=UPI00164D4441|nr:zinc ribbon domain-containing protein [Paenibacillus sp. PAMC21692]QNK59265.1 zinc ribbon domain-containing protein [Paenibacillus sp. PAMC21692]